MKELIERLEKATGPDCELDEAIACWLAKPHPKHGKPVGMINAPRYTSSIDAALTLVQGGGRLRELGQWDDNGAPGGWFAAITQYIQTGERSWECHEFSFGIPDPMEYHKRMPRLAVNGAIALCIAALKAREALARSPAETEIRQSKKSENVTD